MALVPTSTPGVLAGQFFGRVACTRVWNHGTDLTPGERELVL